jgi:hydrogenase expression/formation protein HypD
LKKKYEYFDAMKEFDIRVESGRDLRPGCKCGEILKGLAKPRDCQFFKKVCTPSTPVGPCMVSVEGACNVFFRYGE